MGYLNKLSTGIVDFHSHILPEMDDGSSSIRESVDMLLISKRQGVERIVATPHFYPERESPENFLQRRKLASEKLRSAIKDLSDNVPRICVGAEVAYFNGIYQCEKLHDLCVCGTNYVLVEMPHRSWSRIELEELCRIQVDLGLIPIVAHVERYLPMQEKSVVDRLSEENIIFQLNSEAFSRFFNKRFAMNLVKKDRCVLIGSDCHNLSDRAPNMIDSITEINKKFGIRAVDKINLLANAILETAQFMV